MIWSIERSFLSRIDEFPKWSVSFGPLSTPATSADRSRTIEDDIGSGNHGEFTMNMKRLLFLWTGGLRARVGEARAHFLIIHIGPIAEGGRSAEVTFGEKAGDGDAKFVDKIASTKLWVQTTPGEFARSNPARPATGSRLTCRLRGRLPWSVNASTA